MKRHQKFLKTDELNLHFQVTRRSDEVEIWYLRAPDNYAGNLQEAGSHCLMNVRNIPALIEAMKSAFFSATWGHGEAREICDSGDKISILMDTDPGPKGLYLFFSRKSPRYPESARSVKFNFVHPQEIEPLNNQTRVPTPEIVWFIDTLRDVYREWEGEQKR